MSFEAKFPGRCANGDAITVGDTVTYTPDGELVHDHCDSPADPLTPARNERHCPTCYTVHAGGCW